MISIATMEKLLNVVLVLLLFARRRSLKTNQERLEFIVDAVVTIAIISL